MTFQFKVHPTATGDAARAAYYVPKLPAGVSYELGAAIKRYAELVGSGPDGADDEAFASVKSYPASSISDVIAKIVYQLHFEHRGLSEEGDLIIIENGDDDTAAIELAQTVLGELYAQVPQEWEVARRAYHAALVVENEYDRRVYQPASEEPGWSDKRSAISDESERLMNIRLSFEDCLLSIPAPTLAEWAIKFLICFDSGRDMNGHTDALCTEARQLLGITSAPAADHSLDLPLLEATAAWKAMPLSAPEPKDA